MRIKLSKKRGRLDRAKQQALKYNDEKIKQFKFEQADAEEEENFNELLSAFEDIHESVQVFE